MKNNTDLKAKNHLDTVDAVSALEDSTHKNCSLKTRILSRSNIIGYICLVLSFIIFCVGIYEKKQLKEYQRNGVAVTASVYQVDKVSNGDDTDYYVWFNYEYNNKNYTYCKDGSDYREGDTITAYIYPNHPDELFIYENTFFFGFIPLILGIFFIWIKLSKTAYLKN